MTTDKEWSLALARVCMHELHSPFELGSDRVLCHKLLEELRAHVEASLSGLDASGRAPCLHRHLDDDLADAASYVEERTVAIEGETVECELIIGLYLLLALVHVPTPSRHPVEDVQHPANAVLSELSPAILRSLSCFPPLL